MVEGGCGRDDVRRFHLIPWVDSCMPAIFFTEIHPNEHRSGSSMVDESAVITHSPVIIHSFSSRCELEMDSTDETKRLVPTGAVDMPAPTGSYPSLEPFEAEAATFAHSGTTVTWSDPFYENNKDVIAAFDMDYDYVRRMFSARRNAFLAGAAFCLLLSVVLYKTVFWFSVLLWITVVPLLGQAVDLNKSLHLMLRRHVAIARRGVYVDDADQPHSLRLARRQVIALDTINGCQVDEVGWFLPSYQVKVKHVPPNERALQSLILEGLVDAQAFAEILMESVRQHQEQQQSVSGEPDNIGAINSLQ
jgi:hypothetical protein